jgi:hypothetical protein
MICQRLLLFSFCALCLLSANESPAQKAQNPVIFADVPDMSMMRVGDTYYMSSTTMHMAPGVPVMTSKDLINWKITSYCYDILDEVDALNLVNGKSTYGRGTWASSIRYHKGLFYVSTFAQTTNKTYIYTTDDPEKGEWKKTSFAPAYHDHSLFFDDDGRIYFIWGVGRLRIIELEADLSGVKEETERVLIENASAPAGSPMGLQSEGSQLFKVNGRYYLFNICWPRGGMRTVVIHRASSLEGPWEGRLALQDKGVAQGGMVNTPGDGCLSQRCCSRINIYRCLFLSKTEIIFQTDPYGVARHLGRIGKKQKGSCHQGDIEDIIAGTSKYFLDEYYGKSRRQSHHP